MPPIDRSIAAVAHTGPDARPGLLASVPPALDPQGRVRLESRQGASLCFWLWAVDRAGCEHELPMNLSSDPNFEVPTSEGGGTQRWRFETGEVGIDMPGRFEASVDLCSSQSAEAAWWIEVCVRNPAAALHVGGLWDLGDPGSTLFRGFGLTLRTLETSTETTLHWREAGGDSGIGTPLREASVDDRGLRLVQYSSGGGAWRHHNHVASNGEVPLRLSGWTMEAKGEVESRAHGERCKPLVCFAVDDADETGSWWIRPERFWQNFPTALYARPSSCDIELFARSALDGDGVYELQPGEQKRRQITLELVPSSAIRGEGLEMSASTRPPFESPFASSAESLVNDENLTGIRAITIDDAGEHQLAELLVTANEFFAKRERIDEFGWRHHGEVFADHESLYTDDAVSAPLVSHYNNQYDLVMGFALQYLRTGEPGWYQLMDELALHVVDIDIYHTVEDRTEYNGGLFWHTNHYSEAATATHRTFSRATSDPSDPVGTSGGPGPEHCYTSGLVLHWRLTGDQGSRDAVLELARWIDGWFDGENLLLAQLWLILRRDMPQVLSLMRGRGSVHALPLTRATGNLVVALIDAHEIDGDERWVRRAAEVLRDTFDPGDDIAARRLLDIETNWSYTVFLQAVLRFLELKERRSELDEQWTHARDGLVAYTRWMSENERPYLESPTKLEFVNDTWAAQDTRKYVLLIAACRYDTEWASSYRAAAQRLLTHVLGRLSASEERVFSRLQAILMFNIGIATWATARSTSVNALAPRPLSLPTPVWGQVVIMRAARRLMRGLRAFSPHGEIRWIRSRLRGRGR